MIKYILVFLAVFAFVVPNSVFADSAAPSIRVTSPNKGESFQVKSNKKLNVTWEAANVPAGSKVCVAVIPAYWPVRSLGDITSLNSFDACIPATNGKGKASRKMLDVYKDALYKSGTFFIQTTLIKETPISGVNYQGVPYTSIEFKRLAFDTSDVPFTIKPFTDKKAGIVTTYVDTGSWESGPMYEKDAIAECKNQTFASPLSAVRCEWKGKEIYNNRPTTPKEKTKKVTTSSSTNTTDTSIKSGAEKAIKQAEQEIEETEQALQFAVDETAYYSAFNILVIAKGTLVEAKEFFDAEQWAKAKEAALQADEVAIKADKYRQNRK